MFSNLFFYNYKKVESELEEDKYEPGFFDKLKNKFSDNIVVAKLDVIEALGGGSARCMLTDILCKNIEQAESVLRETGASLRKFGGKTEEHLVVYSLTPQKTLSISAMKNVNNHQMEMGYKFGTA